MNKFFIIIIFVLSVFSGCTAEQTESGIVNFFSMKDCRPPELTESFCCDPFCASLTFDEEVFVKEGWFSNCTATASGQVVTVEFEDELTPDRSFEIEGRVCDRYGNSTSFCVNVWGYNQSPVRALINEVTTKGTDTQPDRTELLITGRGNLAGLTLYDGIPEDRKQYVVLPSAEVEEGDYVVVYWREDLPDKEEPEGVISVCSGNKTGLSDENGILTLSSSPSQGAAVLDCFVYSSFESTKYEGFGTKAVYDRVNRAREEDWWLTRAVDSSDSTSTRSLSRKNTEDTDTAGDWYTTVTKGQTFGRKNDSAVYSK